MIENTIRLFCSDLDGTLIGNPEATHRFKNAWEQLTVNRPLLCFSSGRLLSDVLNLLLNNQLPKPDYLITGVGTEIYDCKAAKPLTEFREPFGKGWDLKLIEKILSEFPNIQIQPPEFLHPYKSSWYLHRADSKTIKELKRRLKDAGLDVNVIYSSARDLDVLPKRASKGYALRWLCSKLGIPLSQVLVAGDTGNDSSMFQLPDVKGIVVDNAQPELFEATVKLPVFVSTRTMADGVLDGLQHFKVIHQQPPVEFPAMNINDLDPAMRMIFSAEVFSSLKQEELTTIAVGYRKAIDVIHKNITPIGFSACSLEDNEIVGTDENYRSVWARDGAITIVSTIMLEDNDIQAAQKQTLKTLFDNVSPNGLIPAYVRVDDGVCDYSGVGGICAIDSGLWAIIAFYHYIQATEDFDFLNEYSDKLQRVMDWSSAHDSNNNGLLEVPEAGDWTDLFGRSYNVLYDEVLWFRANVCYGRLLEFQKDFQRAGDYLRRAQMTRGKILSLFWPSTVKSDEITAITFADRQFSLGDTTYLLAEITPFSFSWRCDVYGNILAFLYNVLDIERARVAFRFMWGVGVNDPYPVANLYPVVQAGDPDWRPYYTVNLMNLPHHYHNGGIWPFVGGMWVRFIHQLGLSDIAVRELYKLALLNKKGKSEEWEFNEWAHGKTGRPMGKKFQAWSAASYLRACHDLQVQPKTNV